METNEILERRLARKDISGVRRQMLWLGETKNKTTWAKQCETERQINSIIARRSQNEDGLESTRRGRDNTANSTSRSKERRKDRMTHYDSTSDFLFPKTVITSMHPIHKKTTRSTYLRFDDNDKVPSLVLPRPALSEKASANSGYTYMNVSMNSSTHNTTSPGGFAFAQ